MKSNKPIRCPYCQWGMLEETTTGWHCAVCKRDILTEELMIFEDETDEPPTENTERQT